MTARESFCLSLRQQRERQGLTLGAVAKSTRISPHMLASLERGDVSYWPGGIYRRSFVRAYAATVGLPPEPTLAEFVRLFPEPGIDPPVQLDDDPNRLRIRLVVEPRWKAAAVRLGWAVCDAAVVLLLAQIASMVLGLGFSTPAAVVALTYYTAGAALFGRSPSAWLAASGAFSRRSREVRDEIAELRHGWLSGLLDPREGSREHQVTT